MAFILNAYNPSHTKEKPGAETIQQLMTRFRNNPPQQIAGIAVETLEDYQTSFSTELKNQQKTLINLPKADVLIFVLKGWEQNCTSP